MMGERLLEQIDQARWVRTDPERGLCVCWHGGHGVHVYTTEGDEVYFFNVGDFSQSEATLEVVQKAVEEHLQEGEK